MVADYLEPGRAFGAADASCARIAFLDFEASGLNAQSWPIEVGWAFADAPGAAARLIQPHADWPVTAWEPSAEALHGVPMARLRAEGEPVAEVCARLNDALEGAAVYSDAPDWDGFWLLRLFAAAGEKPRFQLLDFGRLMRPLAHGAEPELFARADSVAPRIHRAAQDAMHLKALYLLACGEKPV